MGCADCCLSRPRKVRCGMPLELLLVSVVSGVTLVFLATWAVGWWRTAELDDERARRRFLLDHPGATVLEVAVASDRRSALLWLGSDCGVVFVVGDRLATRLCSAASVVRVGAGLRLDFAGFGSPSVQVRVEEEAWGERLNA